MGAGEEEDSMSRCYVVVASSVPSFFFASLIL